MSNFITNQAGHRNVAGAIRALCADAQTAEMKFLVGFFYFSGWAELVDVLEERDDLRIKLLVGLQVDELLGRTIEHGNSPANESQDEIVDRFFASLEKAINNAEMDTEAFYTQVKVFLQMIDEGRLEIRKTLDPNHAKLYLFKAGADNAWGRARFITGSSNLTRAGLRGQDEFNVEIGDYGTEDAEAYFDDLWNRSIEITADDARRDRLTRFIEDQSQAAEITPFEAYMLMLKTYVELQELKQIKPQVIRLMEKRGYTPYSYQLDAVAQALSILDEYNGVIIADVVGLGKSVIASMVAKSLNRRGVVICPPGLVGSRDGKAGGWHMYRHHFEYRDWEITSLGKLEETLDFVQSPEGEDIEVVIVDEAHRFRNQETYDYELLSHICRGKKVILLTATPFNNSPADIFSMLKLFMVPGHSGITLEDNLDDKFALYNVLFRDLAYINRHHNSDDPAKRSKAEQLYEKHFGELPIDLAKVKAASHKLAGDIRAILEPVLIRRNRIDLINDHVYSQEVTELSRTADPQELFFELNGGQASFYQNVIETWFGEDGEFKGAMYQPFNYDGKGEVEDEVQKGFTETSQKNLYEFMRRLLVKRFESSFGAFYQSIGRFERIHGLVLSFIAKTGKYVLDRQLIERIHEYDPEDIEAALDEFAQQLEDNDDDAPRHRDRVYVLKEFVHRDAFLADIQSDLALLTRIREMMDAFDLVANDPKRNLLIEEIDTLRRDDPQRKIIIFSEFTDTVEHISKELQAAFPDAVLTVATGSLSTQAVKRINANFDASVPEEQQADKFHILLSSDKLSEGFNLNRAGAIINYDIPWNPTRVIQRVGRINRIGRKVFEDLYLYNFFPTEQGADIVHSREIAAQKMFLIHNILGEDAKIFDVDEEPSAAELFKRINQNPSESEEESLLTQVRNQLADLGENHPDVLARIAALPARVKTAKASEDNQVAVLQKKGLALFVELVDDPQAEKPPVTELTFGQLLPLVQCPPDQPRLELSSRFWPSYEAIKAYRPTPHRTHTENAVEVKAASNLATAVRLYPQQLGDRLGFVRLLIRDIREFHTLPKYSLRQLSQPNLGGKSPEENVRKLIAIVENLRRRLGDDYLDHVIQEASRFEGKIIIAVENQRP